MELIRGWDHQKSWTSQIKKLATKNRTTKQNKRNMPTSKIPGSDVRQHQIKQRQHKPRCENEQNTKGRPQNNTFVSSITAQRIPVLTMAVLRLLSVSRWYSWDPWEKLKRATFMPALSSFSIIGTDLEAGPKVQTILVFGFFSIAVETPQLASIFFVCVVKKEWTLMLVIEIRGWRRKPRRDFERETLETEKENAVASQTKTNEMRWRRMVGWLNKKELGNVLFIALPCLASHLEYVGVDSFFLIN